MMILWTETPNVTAIPPQVSPVETVYSKGGCGVIVGMAVGTSVDVEVGVMVTVTVAVGISVGGTTRSVALKVIKTAAAPITRKRANNPKATGRLSVIFGIVLPWTAFLVFAVISGALNSEPQTRHLVALSPRRVPQVGQIFVFDLSVDVLIRGKIIPLKTRGINTGELPAK